jgi:1,4-dihydroxy-2-naphthoyl-CoA hydrolase
MAIWFKQDLQLADLAGLGVGTMGEHMGIEFTAVTENSLSARMPVDHRTRQPYGLLHGGASVALAETLGSVAAAMVVDHIKFIVVGLEINANHIRGVKAGFVTGTTTPKHIGGTTQVWEINIVDEQERLVCTSRITVAVLKRPPESDR